MVAVNPNLSGDDYSQPLINNTYLFRCYLSYFSVLQHRGQRPAPALLLSYKWPLKSSALPEPTPTCSCGFAVMVNFLMSLIRRANT